MTLIPNSKCVTCVHMEVPARCAIGQQPNLCGRGELPVLYATGYAPVQQLVKSETNLRDGDRALVKAMVDRHVAAMRQECPAHGRDLAKSMAPFHTNPACRCGKVSVETVVQTVRQNQPPRDRVRVSDDLIKSFAVEVLTGGLVKS